jgi:hypothetical protein
MQKRIVWGTYMLLSLGEEIKDQFKMEEVKNQFIMTKVKDRALHIIIISI